MAAVKAVAPIVESPDVASFAEPVLAHLKRIYESLSHNNSQSGFDAIQNDPEVNSPDARFTSLASFFAYMASPDARANQRAENPNLSAPISQYYISSSHNTYLTGNQLYSEASAAAYTQVLLHGCRCLEIDVWDGLIRSPSTNSNSSSSESNGKQPPDHLSRVKSLSHGVRHLVKRATSTRKSKGNGTMEAQMSSRAGTDQDDSGGSRTASEPRVLHGHTFTKEVSFRDVCYAIRDSAFVQNDLPIIVSLEVHADLDQQQMMVDIMRESWRGYLVEIAAGEETDLPRLQDLRRKILIKVKWSPPSPQASQEAAPTEEKPAEAQVDPKSLDMVAANNSPHHKKVKASKILNALSELAVYTRAYHFRHFTQEEATIPTHVFSLSEAAVKEAHEKDHRALLDHNREFLMRVYPAGFRVNSSNLDPTFFWQQGAQMVALNWQKYDKGMMINDAMFPDGTGWALKPFQYRTSTHVVDGGQNVPRKSIAPNLDFSIEIYAGQQIPHPGDNSASGDNFHPYVICQLHLGRAEAPASKPPGQAHNAETATVNDKLDKKFKLRTKRSTGTNPDFKGERLVFPSAKRILEDLSFIRFKIKDDEWGRDSLAAWACIRLDRLRQGYRFVHLKDALGRPSAGFLLVKINKQVSDS